METSILLVRHPETHANVSGRFVGRGHSPYTSVGRRQYGRLPRKIARFAPDIVWSSPLERAHKVAVRAASLADVDLIVDERLVELDFGEAEGMTYEEIVEAGLMFNYRSLEDPVAPGGESRESIHRRVASFCDGLTADSGRHAIVTHGGVFRASLIHLLGLSTEDIWAFHIHNAQLARVHVVDGHGMLEEYVAG